MFLIKPYQLTILTTNQCPASCRHCTMSAGPKRRDRLTFEQIRAAVDAVHGVNRVLVVVFAGGEPMLLGEHLLDAIAHCASLGIVTRIVTSAYWATSERRARAKLIALREAGLAELNISADDFHAPFVPLDYVENAWRASKGLGFHAVVIANCCGQRSTITPQYIMNRLGEELHTRYDESGRSQRLCSPAADGTIYTLSNAYIQRLGRAVTTITDEDLIFPAAQDKLNVYCPWLLRSPALSPQGHLLGCCGIEAEHNPVLDLGDPATTDMAELVAEADDNLLVNALALLGPMFVKGFIQRRAPDVQFRDTYATVCEICADVVTRPEAIGVVNSHLPDLAPCVLAAREKLGEAA